MGYYSARKESRRSWLKRRTQHRSAVALLVFGIVTACGARARGDAMNQTGTSGPPPQVRVVLGWRAREIERASTARVRFPDDDRSTIVLENDPSVLVYADPAHSFTLPPGRFLRADQSAGRVYSISVTPHLDALTMQSARVLADSVGTLLERAGWQRAPGQGIGADAALRASARMAVDPAAGFGVVDVAQWRLPRANAPWTTLPPGAPTTAWDGGWNGPEAAIDVKPVRPADPVGNAHGVLFVLELRLTDESLSAALSYQVDARRERLNGEPQTLASWDRQPNEDITALVRRRAAEAMARSTRP